MAGRSGRLVAVLVVVALLAALGVTILYRLGDVQAMVLSIERLHAWEGMPVRVVRPHRRAFADYLVCDGSVMADVRGMLRAKVGEIVEAVHARVGEPVKKGQVLVEFRKTDLEAAIQAAETASEEAENNYRRLASLLEQNVISEDRLEEARTRKENIAAALRTARSRLKFSEVASPIDGVVERRWVEPGEYKGIGDELLSVVDLSTVEVAALVPEEQVATVSIGEEGEFRIESGPDWLQGQVSRISPSTADPNRFFDIYLKVDNRRVSGDWLMRPGMYAEVRFQRKYVADALAVPDDTLVREGDLRTIYVVESATKLFPILPEPDVAEGFGVRIKRGFGRARAGLSRLMARGGQEAAQGAGWSAELPQEERQVKTARKLTVSLGLREAEHVQLLQPEVTEESLVVINPRDDMRDGTMVKIVEGGD